MEMIVKEGVGDKAFFGSWKKAMLEQYSKSNYVDEVLPQHCIDILMKYQKMFQVYDYLFIDEVQDFSTWFLWVALDLLKNQNNIFVVGDVAQKLFDRELDWSEFDIVKQRAELERRFFMYRSPRPVAKLAWRFLTSNRFIEGDLKDEGYETEVKIKSPFTHPPEFLAGTTNERLLQSVVKDIQSRLLVAQRKQLLCIGLKDKLLGELYQALIAASVPVCWATETSLISGDYVVLADYMEAKGLEREYVYILDADHLALKESPFATEEQVAKELRRDRIKLFVALTRAMREVRIYYIDSYHTFIRQLLQIDSTL
jgi:superfamily I DNA and RNA helicase